MSEEAITAVLAAFDDLIKEMTAIFRDSYEGDYYGVHPYSVALASVEEHRDIFARQHGRQALYTG